MPELKAAAGSGRQAGEQKEFMALNEYFRFEECIILGALAQAQARWELNDSLFYP